MPSLYSSRQARPKKRWWHIVQSLFFIFVFSLAAFIFLQSAVFSVREITVHGNKQLGAQDIISLAGLRKDVNIFKTNLKEARDKVALHPMVQNVEIRRDLPASITIDLTERKALALISNGSSFLVISEDGCLLSSVTNLNSTNLPFITGVKATPVGPGQKLLDTKLQIARDYLIGMPLSLRAAVSEINVSDLNNILVFTIDRVEVRFGDDGRIAEKVKLYQEVISRKYKDKIQYIDISYKGNPVIKFIQPQQEEPGIGP